MAYVWVIVVYNLLHVPQAVLPETFPDLNSCKAALVQKVFAAPNWGQCKAKPAEWMKRHYHRRPVLHSKG
jgi:hypothetical protein